MITANEVFNLELPETLHYHTEDSMDNFHSMGWFLYESGLEQYITENGGTYVEVTNGNKILGIHAGGDGDFYSHNFKIEEI